MPVCCTHSLFCLMSDFYRKKTRLCLILQIVFFALLIVVDQLTKSAAVAALKGNAPVTVIKGFADFEYLENTGAAFGILENAMWFFYLITVVIFIVIAVIWIRIHTGLLQYAAVTEDAEKFNQKNFNGMLFLGFLLAALAAGAIGNLIDRLVNGYVVDFIRFTFIQFPIFNFADICVTVSVVLLCVFFIFVYREDPAFKIFGRKNRNKDPEA